MVFDGAPVLAVLGEPGEIAREPYFGRDAIRTAACWAGLVDAVREEALAALAQRPADDDLSALAAGRMVSAAGTIDAWFERAAAAVEADPGAPAVDLSVALRAAVETAARLTVDQAVRAAGSRPLAAGRAPGPRPPRPGAVPEPAPAGPAAGQARPQGPGGVSAPPGARLERAYFDDLYRRDPDPWDFATSDYERDKYADSLAALGDRRFAPRARGRAARSACSRRRWPARCGELGGGRVARRPSPRRASGPPALANVHVGQATLPEDMPAGAFDLIVCSEVLYYWDERLLEHGLDALAGALEPGGLLLAVHWPERTREYPLQGDEVHERAGAARRPGAGRTATTDPTTGSTCFDARVSSRRGLVIVGGGPAGLATARAFREAGGDGAVTIVAAEPHAPYERPPLTKEFLRGEAAEHDLPIEDELWFARHKVELRTRGPGHRPGPGRAAGRARRRRAPRATSTACWPPVGAAAPPRARGRRSRRPDHAQHRGRAGAAGPRRAAWWSSAPGSWAARRRRRWPRAARAVTRGHGRGAAAVRAAGARGRRADRRLDGGSPGSSS